MRAVADGGAATITTARACGDYGGLTLFTLSNGDFVFLYHGSDAHTQAMLTIMTTAWAAGKKIASYTTDGSGDNCGYYSGHLASVNFSN